jgi:hypothetical protein
MGKKKTKGVPPPEEHRFKDLPRRLVAVPREEIEGQRQEYRRMRKSRKRS